MIENATVRFSNGRDLEAEKVKFIEGGFVGIRATDGWAYYPREHIGRVVARDDDE